MNIPNFELIRQHLMLGDPLPSFSIEQKIVDAFKKCVPERRYKSSSIPVPLSLGDAIIELSSKEWNLMVIADYGRTLNVKREDFVKLQSHAVIMPTTVQKEYFDAFERTSREIYHLGPCAGDIMSDEYVQKFKHHRI